MADPQEITEELKHSGARNLLDSATLRRLAYNGSDGFTSNLDRLLLEREPDRHLHGGDRPKVKALSSRPNVAMTIEGGDTPTGGAGAPGAWGRKR